MALGPKDLMQAEVVNTTALEQIEAHIDAKLQEATYDPGKMVALSFVELNVSINKATQKGLLHRYRTVGWQAVSLDYVNRILTMKWPVYRGD
jgi:hypothetical protein